ncbi:MAG TPA: SCP2 sterol-binding domain-containing protein, partial [Actinomycetota bacterium]|nr:SCP2 sterol-binding domain-containing protein [Actinomycetota bacterium]
VLIHGYDITKAEGRPWHIDPHAAALSGRGVSPMAIDYVDKEAAAGLRACFDLRMRGQWQLHYVFSDGELSIEEPTDRRVDVHISADPVAFLLVAYGRISQWGPIATGKIAAWGRKPWLAMRFGSLLRNP